MRIGRNELCHCGSGRKYKRCCFAKDRAAESLVLAEKRPEGLVDPEPSNVEPNSDPCTIDWDSQLGIWQLFWTIPYRPGPREHSRLVWPRVLVEQAELVEELHARYPMVAAKWERRRSEATGTFFACLDCGEYIDLPPPPIPPELVEALKLTEPCSATLADDQLARELDVELKGAHRDVRSQQYFTTKVRKQLAKEPRFSTLGATLASQPDRSTRFAACIACGMCGWIPRNLRPAAAVEAAEHGGSPTPPSDHS